MGKKKDLTATSKVIKRGAATSGHLEWSRKAVIPIPEPGTKRGVHRAERC
jgi:hypothetical protein